MLLYFVVIYSLCYLCRAQDCSSTKDPGFQCDESDSGRKFYFDTRMKVCQPFNYQGCGGNENRYDSAKECKEACSKKKVEQQRPLPKGHSQWIHADKCGATHLVPDGKLEECRPGKSLCPENHKCKNGVCCPTKDYVCSLRDDTGTFADGVDDLPRFAWSDDIQSCWRFSYYGAKGNYNNFASFRDCLNFCSPSK